MDTTSYWHRTSTLPEFPSLENDVSVDVAIVGGGITGVTAAFLLKQRGFKVALLERERCGHGDTGQTTAHLTCMPDARLRGIEKDFDRAAARAVWQAGSTAIYKIFELVRSLEIDCNFQWVPGILHAATHEDAAEVEAEAKLAIELGIPCEFRTSGPFFSQPAAVFPNQAKFHPLRYIAAILARIPGDGSYVFEQSGVTEIEDTPLVLHSERGRVRCRHLILATHNPFTGIGSKLGTLLFQTKLALYTSYVVGAKLPAGSIPSALYWDTADPYRYLRIEQRGQHDYAIFGGADHKTGQGLNSDETFRRLEADLFRFAPKAVVDAHWSGQVIETTDGLPFIGGTSDHQFIATGFAGNGMTFGTLSGIMAADFVRGRQNQWVELFKPGRVKLHGGTWTFIEENIDYPVHLACGWLGKTDERSPADLAPEEGAVLRINGRHAAVYKDKTGGISACSAVCTHLGCIVGWNVAEKTWDCPCHGSRFHPTGEVMSGPAQESLEKLTMPTPAETANK